MQRVGRRRERRRTGDDARPVSINLDGEPGPRAPRELHEGALRDRLERFEEARSLLRKTMPVARRVLGESQELTLQMRWNYATALYKDASATLDDLREAVTTLEDTERIARRVLGGAHPVAAGIELSLRNARSVLAAREAGEDMVSKTLPPG